MQGNSSKKIPGALKRRLDSSGIIGNLASGIVTRRSAKLAECQECFFTEVSHFDPHLAEFCRQNKTFLGLNDMHTASPEELRAMASSFVEGYDATLAMHEEANKIRSTILEAEKRLREADDREKQALIADLARIAKSSGAMAQVNATIERTTGLNISEGFSGLMKSLASKIGPKGGGDDPTKTRTDLEYIDMIKSAKSISTVITLAKGIAVAIVAPGGLPLVGAGLTMLPIVTMVWPALAAWDILSLPSNMMGSPFASGNLNNLVKECEAGFSSGPKIAENMQDSSAKRSKGRTV